MQKWPHKTIPLSALAVTPVGILGSKCDSCTSVDCAHRIEYQTVSIIGINRKMKCVISGDEPRLVIDCEGYNE